MNFETDEENLFYDEDEFDTAEAKMLLSLDSPDNLFDDIDSIETL